MSDINNTSAALATSEDNPGNSATVKDVSLDDAFMQLADKWDNPIEDAVVNNEDSSDKQEIETSDEEPDNRTQSQSNSPVVTDQPQVNEISDSSTGTDYRQLYEQAIREREVQQSQLNMVYGRLNELSDRYQELKSNKESTSEPVKQQLSSEVQELYDVYPDIAKAVEKLIDSKVSVTEEGIKKAFEPKNIQMQQQLQQVAAQNYVNRVLAAHPDTMQLVQSNTLRNWVNALEPLQRTGAEYVMKYGSADDVIGLISQYKASSKPSGNNPNSTNQSTSEDALVKKVIAAMNVPSNRQEPAIIKQQATEYSSVDAAFEALAKTYESSMK